MDPGAGLAGEAAATHSPAAILVAGAVRMEEAAFPETEFPAFEVLVDATRPRVLPGTPRAPRSTFAQLLFLDGRYAERYRKFDERTTFGGDRVQTWRVLFK